MAFSRIRHDLPGGDFDRSANQQRVLRGIQGAIRAQADEPGFIERGVLTVLRAHGHRRRPRPSCSASPRPSPRSTPPRSPAAWCRAASPTSTAPASSCPTSTRPAATATLPARTPRSNDAERRRRCGRAAPAAPRLPRRAEGLPSGHPGAAGGRRWPRGARPRQRRSLRRRFRRRRRLLRDLRLTSSPRCCCARPTGPARVSLRDFYARRARRILPAALLVIVATLVLSVMYLDGAAALLVGEQAIWAHVLRCQHQVRERQHRLLLRRPAAPRRCSTTGRSRSRSSSTCSGR